ncbi:hypothetical protein B0J14DRAFT_373825 [Halenospora varia]|nr:hypothetical protein B0J14DRAFT_373825 [Halenospora varia]
MELRKSTTVVKHQRSLEIQWAYIIAQYSMRQMTRETDRFPALSGLAKQIQAAGLAPLVAGIPANNVLPWLLWDSEPSKRRHSVYIAPSWSWASFNCASKISFYHPYLSQPKMSVESEPIAQVVDIVAEAAGLDPTGALKSGYLILYSLVTMATFKYDIHIFWGSKTSLHMRNLEGSENMVHNPHIDYDEDKENLNEQKLLVVLICRVKTFGVDNLDDADDWDTFGLVLELVGESLYRRVGWCYFRTIDESSTDYELREVTII